MKQVVDSMTHSAHQCVRRVAGKISDLRLTVNHQVRRVRNQRLARQFNPLHGDYQTPEVDSSVYDQYYQEAQHRYEDSYGRRFIKDVCRNLDFNTALDAGCGSGIIVRYLRAKGYVARGIELSDWIVHTQCADLLQDGAVQIGSLDKLPYRDNSFDLVFSSDVLEHIPEDVIPQVVSELVRVSRRDLFLSISLRPSSMNNKYHLTLKPREWWERRFLDCGVSVNRELVDRLQKKSPGTNNFEVLKAGCSPGLLNEMSWFVKQEPYSLNGEFEPWFFAFHKPRGS
jgi:2-polyprenyl-3-methyl-5-hydroxy-6-metoxy-1,4-benzoquinol methylase